MKVYINGVIRSAYIDDNLSIHIDELIIYNHCHRGIIYLSTTTISTSTATIYTNIYISHRHVQFFYLVLTIYLKLSILQSFFGK